MPRLRLQKPQQCTACGSDSLRQEFKPTRWICNDCDIVVVSRPSRPISGICLYCGAKKADGVIFVKGKNRCLECKSKLGRKWHTENRKPYQPGAARKSAQRSPEAFIKYLVGRVRSRSIQSKMRRGGLEIPAKKVETLRTVTITPGHMIEVFYQQQGLCALTGLKMLHQIGDLLSMSLDRKDSDIGYIVGNVQLVCQFANKAKGSSSDEAILAVFAAIRVQQRSPFLD